MYIGETELNIINLHHFVVPIGGRRNIITQVAPQYRCLGVHLLNDKKGNVVQSMHMANHGDPVGIMTAIFTQWLREDTECSWKKLIECMKRCDLTHFAQEMEVALGLTLQGNFKIIDVMHMILSQLYIFTSEVAIRTFIMWE